MKISSENIEIFLYDYFEGNLEESEKTELMEFLHTNPEYEADFTSYAQSYALTGEQVPDYDISNQLIRNDKSFWIKKYKYPIVGLALISSILLGLLLLKEKPEVENVVKIKSKVPTSTVEVPTVVLQPKPGNVQNVEAIGDLKLSEKHISKAIKKVETLEINIEENEVIEEVVKVETVESVKVDENKAKTEMPNLVDSTDVIVVENEESNVEETKLNERNTRRKNKRKLSLKPSGKILEVNPNF